MTDYHPRNWTGYADRPPPFRWPGNKRLIINIVLNYEEGAERNVLDGDPESENYLTGFPELPSLKGDRFYTSENLFAYGSRVGCWRLYRLFKTFNIPITVFACGQALERNPEFASALGSSPHEVAGHGYRWISYRNHSMEEERLDIQKTLKSIQRTTGKNPVGWYTGRKSKNTRRLIMEEGLLYDSDDYSDDAPWWLQAENRNHLVIPYTLLNNDCLYCTSPGWITPQQFLEHLKDTFSALYREGRKQTQIMTIGLHSRLSGQPGRSEAVRRFIAFAQRHRGVEFVTREQIALEWLTQCPSSNYS